MAKGIWMNLFADYDAISGKLQLKLASSWYNWVLKGSAMTVEIPRELQDFVDHLVESGKYPSAAAVVTAALNSLDEKEAAIELPAGQVRAMFPDLDEGIAEGLEDLEAGRASDGEEFFEELLRELSQDPSQDRKTA